MNIAVCGLGRAGKELARKIVLETENDLVMGLCREESRTAGMDIGELMGMPKFSCNMWKISECEQVLLDKKVDVIIDFSGKSTSLELVPLCESPPEAKCR